MQLLTVSLLWIVLQIGLSHYLATLFLDARASYLGIMRAYMLAQMFRLLVVIPAIGGILVGIGDIAVLMMVFEEVDGVERMEAFMLAAAIGIVFWISSIWWLTSGAHPPMIR